MNEFLYFVFSWLILSTVTGTFLVIWNASRGKKYSEGQLDKVTLWSLAFPVIWLKAILYFIQKNLK